MSTGLGVEAHCFHEEHSVHLTDSLFHPMGNRDTRQRELPQRRETRTVTLEIRGPPGRDPCLSKFRGLEYGKTRAKRDRDVVLIKEGGNRTTHVLL